MKIKLTRQDPRRGSALLASLIVIVILTFAAAGILSYSLTNYRNSVRQALTDQAKELADSEMENLYYAWKNALLAKTAIASLNTATVGDELPGILASTTPFPAGFQVPPVGGINNWSVSRALTFNPVGAGDGSAQGIVPGTLQIGKNYYFTAETSATSTNPLFGAVTFHSGRHFVFSSTSLFQFAVFYQGNLEMAAGSDMTILGPVSTNASAFLGSQSGYELKLTDMVYYFQDYNGASDPLSGETDRLYGGSTLTDPVYNPDATVGSAAPADQVAQRALQVSKMSTQSSFVGGVDVASDIANPAYTAAYTNLLGVVDVNEIYRAVVGPAPRDAVIADPTYGYLDAEDPVVAQSRMYNNAALLITVEQTAPGVPTLGTNLTIHVGIADQTQGTAAQPNISIYDALFPTITSTVGAPTDVITAVRQTVIDPREAVNGSSGVNMTTLDIGNLNNAVSAYIAANAGSQLATNYNGVVYIYDKTDNSAAEANVPNTLNGIRITDATTTPNISDQNGNPFGFSVVTDNGLYVQGDYNTTQINIPGNVGLANNPAALMGDAVTLLSYGWQVPSGANYGTLPAIGSRQATFSPPVAANGVYNPADILGTPNGMSVNAAILTGNTPANPSTGSGGAQNLVRMMEDWWGPGLTLNLDGSLGQLFTSKYFTGAYVGTGGQPALGGDNVYIQPSIRNFQYDVGFKAHTPAGSPTTTNFTKGDFFFW